MVYQLIYISTFGVSVTPDDVDAILVSARRHNLHSGITGILIADGTRFLQVLEGAEASVKTTFNRIKQDRRHFAVHEILAREVNDRAFAGWEMAYREVANPADHDNLAKQAELMVTNLSDDVLRERLRYFLRLDRQHL